MTRLPTGAGAAPENANEGESEPQTLSLLGGVARPEGLPEVDLDLQSMKGPSKLMSSGTLMVLGLFAIAVALLYAMKLTHGESKVDSAAKAAEAKIEQALAKLTSPQRLPANDPLRKENVDAVFSDTKAIMAMFTEDLTQRQVPIEYVQKNPFTLHTATPAVIGPAKTNTQDNRRLEKLKAELKGFELQTIMSGSRPVAVISGEILRPGDKLGSFTVKEIRPFAVLLEGEGQVFTLEMQKPQEQGGSRR